MHLSRKYLLGGAAILTVAGFCGLAAASDALHTMTVKSPDGGTVTIHYTGNVAPQVAFAPATQAAAITRFNAPFLMMDRIAAQMDRQMNDMIARANAMMAHLPDANPAISASFWNMPINPGGLSAIAAGGKGAFCMKSMEITSAGDGKAPHVVTRTAGNCGGSGPTSPAHGNGVQGAGPKTQI